MRHECRNPCQLKCLGFDLRDTHWSATFSSLQYEQSTLLLVYFNFTAKNNSPNRKKTYNVDETRVVNMDQLWICWKRNFQLKTLATITVAILKKWLTERKWRRNGLGVLYISRNLRSSLKLGPRKLNWVLNSISASCNFQIHTNVKKTRIEFQTRSQHLEPNLKLGPDYLS
jgi:hypothetical protein